MENGDSTLTFYLFQEKSVNKLGKKVESRASVRIADDSIHSVETAWVETAWDDALHGREITAPGMGEEVVMALLLMCILISAFSCASTLTIIDNILKTHS